MREKMKIAGLVTVTVLVWGVFVTGCVTVSIEKQYPERREKTYIGMSFEEFKEIWPDANYAGTEQSGGEVYTVGSYKLYSGISMEYF